MALPIQTVYPRTHELLNKGLMRDTFVNFKHLRKTAHTHHPVDDAKGNAEALLALKDEYQLKIRW
jgi:hypothetical protein